MPETTDIIALRKGYRKLRHDVTACSTFTDFARNLAKEYRDSIASNHIDKPKSELNSMMRPLYSTDVVFKYNRDEDENRRLSNRLRHIPKKGKSFHCSLCSYSHSILYKGKRFRKKGGSIERRWCGVCQQPICSKCWDAWHTSAVLQRAEIPSAALEKLQQRARSSM